MANALDNLSSSAFREGRMGNIVETNIAGDEKYTERDMKDLFFGCKDR